MQRNALRRAFKPPSFVDKPLPEQSKGFTPQPAAQKEQPQAPDASQAMQSVKRRRLLICPTSISCPKPSASTTRMVSSRKGRILAMQDVLRLLKRRTWT